MVTDRNRAVRGEFRPDEFRDMFGEMMVEGVEVEEAGKEGTDSRPGISTRGLLLPEVTVRVRIRCLPVSGETPPGRDA